MKRLEPQHICLPIVWVICLLLIWGCSHPSAAPDAEDPQSRSEPVFDQLSSLERQAAPATTRRTETESPTPSRRSAAMGQRPDWLNGQSAVYEPDEFFIGVGMGPDRRSAENSARTEIAKIFHSLVQAKSRVYQNYLSGSAESGTAVTERIDIQDITQVTTRKVLSGVIIAQVYRDATTPDTPFYALALLNRRQTAEVLTRKIIDLDNQITALMLKADTQTDTLVRVQYVSQSLTHFLQRQLYDAELRIVHPSGTGVAAAAELSEIDTRLKEILSNELLIGVSVSGRKSSEIRQALTTALNRKGFAVIDDKRRATVLARGTLEIVPIEQGASEWKFVRWNVYIDLVDQTGGAVFGSVVKSGKEGHLTLSQAEDRAVRKMESELASQIADTLAGYILKPPKP